MPGGPKSDVKLGFFLGLGLLLAFALGTLVQGLVSRVRAGAGGG